MTQHQIPARVQILVDTSDFPTITGASVYETWLCQPANQGKTESDFLADMRGAPTVVPSPGPLVYLSAGAATSSLVYAATGLSVGVIPSSPTKKVRLSVQGAVSNSLSNMITQLTLFRKTSIGTFQNITPAGHTALAAVRPETPDRMENFSFAWEDFPGSTEELTYALYWKTYGGVSRLGQRNADAIMMVPTTMTAVEV